MPLHGLQDPVFDPDLSIPRSASSAATPPCSSNRQSGQGCRSLGLATNPIMGR
jgi:hypothetical protein